MLRLLKKSLVFCLISGICLTPTLTEASTNPLIYYDGQPLMTQASIIMQQDHILISLRDYFEAVGMDVHWSESSRTATVTAEEQAILLAPDEGDIYINGVKQSAGVGVQIIDNKIYIPLRFLSEAFGYQVNYSTESGQPMITITTHSTPTVPIGNIISTKNNMKLIQHVTQPVTISSTGQGADYQQWKTQHTEYLINSDGNVIELVSLGKTIEIRIIDGKTGTVDCQTVEGNQDFNYFSDIVNTSAGFTVIMNRTPVEGGYIGQGTPNSYVKVNGYSTKNGVYDLYESHDDVFVIHLDKHGVAIDNGVLDESDYLLDASQTFLGYNCGSYAVSNDGDYAYMINGQLLILDSLKGQIIEEGLLNNASDNKVVSVNDYFLILAAQPIESYVTTNDVYSAVYNTDGQKIISLKLADADLNGQNVTFGPAITDEENDKVYFIVDVDAQTYLVTYQVRFGNMDIQELGPTLSRFVVTTDGYQLFGTDAQYFYVAPLS